MIGIHRLECCYAVFIHCAVFLSPAGGALFPWSRGFVSAELAGAEAAACDFTIHWAARSLTSILQFHEMP